MYIRLKWTNHSQVQYGSVVYGVISCHQPSTSLKFKMEHPNFASPKRRSSGNLQVPSSELYLGGVLHPCRWEILDCH